MAEDDSAFAEKLLATFRVEAQEHIDAIAAGLIELETQVSPDQHAAVVEAVFRETHSLKGAARSVDLHDIEELCQALENVFSAAKREEISLTLETFDHLHKGVTILETLFKGDEPAVREARRESKAFIPVLADIAKGTVPVPARKDMAGTGPGQGAVPAPESFPAVPIPGLPAGKPEKETPSAQPETTPPVVGLEKKIPPGTTGSADTGTQADTIRVSATRLDSLLLQAEELGDAKRAAGQRTMDLEVLCREFLPWKRRWGLLRTPLMALRRKTGPALLQKHDARLMADLHKITDFLEYNADFILNMESGLVREKMKTGTDHQFLLERTDTLINDMKGLLMMPAGSVLESFPRFVREFTHEKGKEVNLVIEGGEILMDRRILEGMKDAFIHLVRNALDHGIEKPDIREKKGKPPTGRISIRFRHYEGKKVEIFVSDDGEGIDPSRIREAAITCGTLTKEECDRLNDNEILPVVFQSGLTTSRIITDTSGRGLGLAIVMEKVNKIGGTIAMDTSVGTGTSFRIILPLTLATFKGLIVTESRQTFVFPLTSVERVLQVSPESVKTVESQAVIDLGDEQVALTGLSGLLGIPRNEPENAPRKISAIIIGMNDKRLAITVDEIGYVQDVMIKGLGPQLVRVRNFTSATVLATGKVVPVVHAGDLVTSSVRMHAGGGAITPASAVPEGKKKQSVLVVEDSITSRMLLKNILEGGGYVVETAVDGMDGITKLRAGAFDIVVSDVDMPRMNGFALTEKIRSDKKLSETPVVLVTALDSPQDRERGIDVGADAYIVKASFDQSNLLEVVKKLTGRGKA